ncbi:MAG TPA: OB-fold nucleic acid binding domain-containing protein [Caldisericia bacterium]|nr:OB-fold nucleic acid binding domain-containing protein [Caldisericia bacterium]HOC79764.1 OB-fold nucleic acid binding domain-containing protein [Caldisericia bacterium]HOG70719.1 OB-fold nucleic acid binding domain-containing protein [Caldisericia bacterium]HPA65107.1 OB-fold nucleic acid binding domain-containing protein [Caldisericia bacterium]HQL68719.1 OB-fold nucleic acid binding domain-containing protein [Caldisericia bacterium]
MNHTFISDFQKGQEIDDYYAVAKKTKRSTKNGSYFISLTLSDRTGRVDAVVWNATLTKFGEDYNENQVVRVCGRVDEYDGKVQIVVEKIGIGDATRYEASWFLPQSPVPVDDVMKQILSLVASVKDEKLKLLAESFLGSEDYSPNFRVAPGAVYLHHAYLGGLAVHTLGVMKICDFLCQLYPLNRDLLIVASLFHDVGKMVENTWELIFKRTIEGELVGHLIISRDILREFTKSVGIATEVALHLEHCILSHHGQYLYGSPKLPMTREAFALHVADLADSRFEEFERELKNIAQGESTDPIRYLDNIRLFNL